MIFFYSGAATRIPTIVLGAEATLMTTYWDSKVKPCKVHREMASGELPFKLNFLDSGSFSLRTKAAKWGKKHGKGEFDWYSTEEFDQYLEGYANFIQEGSHWIHYYPNLDVIPNRELSWKHQKRLESMGLSPVPVIHYSPDVNSDIALLRRYLDAGHNHIALGGLAMSLTSAYSCHRWIGRMFEEVCGPDGLPFVKIHGFGVSSFEFLRRYPFSSVDSTAWNKRAGYGMIFVPWYRDGKWDFEKTPLCPFVASDSKYRGGIECDDALDGDLLEIGIKQTSRPTQHVMDWRGRKRELVEMWLEEIGSSFDRVAAEFEERSMANVKFYDRFTKTRPEWPWPFRNLLPEEDSFGL